MKKITIGIFALAIMLVLSGCTSKKTSEKPAVEPSKQAPAKTQENAQTKEGEKGQVVATTEDPTKGERDKALAAATAVLQGLMKPAEQAAQDAAAAALTDAGKANAPKAGNGYNFTQLFGVQDVPEDGYDLISVSVDKEMAWAVVDLKFKAGTAEKVIEIKKVSGQWKVDKVTKRQ